MKQNPKNIAAEIIAEAPEERRALLASFLQTPELAQFNRFLGDCSRTEGWSNNREAMNGALSQLVDSMSQNDLLKTKCLKIAATAFGTCGDRLALSYVNTLLAQNTERMPIAKMNPAQLFDYARQELAIKFLNEKAEIRVNEITARGGFLDPIETHLAYLQAPHG